MQSRRSQQHCHNIMDIGQHNEIIYRAQSHRHRQTTKGKDSLNDGEMLQRKINEKETWKNTGTIIKVS